MAREGNSRARVDAIYEGGVLKPLKPLDLGEGRRVSLTIEEEAIQTETPEESLKAWQEVYAGLSEEDVAEVESIALDRGNFMSPEQE